MSPIEEVLWREFKSTFGVPEGVEPAYVKCQRWGGGLYSFEGEGGAAGSGLRCHVDERSRLGVCGDFCLAAGGKEGSVTPAEGALLSGLAAAEAMAAFLP